MQYKIADQAQEDSASADWLPIGYRWLGRAHLFCLHLMRAHMPVRALPWHQSEGTGFALGSTRCMCMTTGRRDALRSPAWQPEHSDTCARSEWRLRRQGRQPTRLTADLLLQLASHPSTNSTRQSSKENGQNEARPAQKGDRKGADVPDDESDDSSKSGSRVVAEREPGQFINIRYDMLVDWLAAYITDKKPADWIKEWKIVFNRVLPLHTFIRCGCPCGHRIVARRSVDDSLHCCSSVEGPTMCVAHGSTGFKHYEGSSSNDALRDLHLERARMFCRTQSSFKHLVDEYRQLDPNQTEQTPLQSALPEKQQMCGHPLQRAARSSNATCCGVFALRSVCAESCLAACVREPQQ